MAKNAPKDWSGRPLALTVMVSSGKTLVANRLAIFTREHCAVERSTFLILTSKLDLFLPFKRRHGFFDQSPIKDIGNRMGSAVRIPVKGGGLFLGRIRCRKSG